MPPEKTPQKRFTAFTAHAPGRLRELITQVGISIPITGPIKHGDSRIIDSRALWDTGATNSAITKSTARQLNLQPISKAIVHHAKGQSIVNVYLINIYLPNKVAVPTIRVTECEDNATWGMIIGMDIITAGDFAITNQGGKTVFSFRLPSLTTIDFIPEKKDPSNEGERSIPRVGRNEKCPCGSGKKYKHCHGG